jgi:hypothetical protein
MSAFHEFHEPFKVSTPQGPGRALLIERTAHDYLWTVALDSCALVTFTQDKILIGRNYTHGRGITDEQMATYIRERCELADRGLVPNDDFVELALRKRAAQEQATRDAMDELETKARNKFLRGWWDDSRRQRPQPRFYDPGDVNWWN